MSATRDGYAKRFRIETFFSDQKSRGFHLHKSHLSDPVRDTPDDRCLPSVHLDRVSWCCGQAR